MSLAAVLEGVTRQHGVRGALVVSAGDGLIVADALMEDVDGAAVAALTASLVSRMRAVARALGDAAPVLLHLAGGDGALLAATATEEMLVVAVTSPEVNLGALRLALRRAAEQVA
ncbi:MAG: roadblock/LC7 domain-containing protein [Gemmatimonadales bacterium]